MSIRDRSYVVVLGFTLWGVTASCAPPARCVSPVPAEPQTLTRVAAAQTISCCTTRCLHIMEVAPARSPEIYATRMAHVSERCARICHDAPPCA